MINVPIPGPEPKPPPMPPPPFPGQKPVREPEPPRLPDENPLPNPDENDEPPQHAGSQFPAADACIELDYREIAPDAAKPDGWMDIDPRAQRQNG